MIPPTGRRPPPRPRPGFTLVELCYVLAIISLLASLGVPTYDSILRRARQEEARAMVALIAHAELRHFRDQGVFLACGPVGPIPDGGSLPFPAEEGCWWRLGVRAEAPVRYRYAVELIDGSFLVSAETKDDRDGQSSRVTLRGSDFHLEVGEGPE